ncbi:UNVERIFIED_CONTAM: hypothetical protein K2H54_032092 [Gekko kuhli]
MTLMLINVIINRQWQEAENDGMLCHHDMSVLLSLERGGAIGGQRWRALSAPYKALELILACRHIGVLPGILIRCLQLLVSIELRDLPDHPSVEWDTRLLSALILKQIETNHINLSHFDDPDPIQK